jgi:hypothetical protein
VRDDSRPIPDPPARFTDGATAAARRLRYPTGALGTRQEADDRGDEPAHEPSSQPGCTGARAYQRNVAPISGPLKRTSCKSELDFMS